MGKSAKGGKGRGPLGAGMKPPGQRPASGQSPIRPMTLILFAVVFLVLFSPGLRELMGTMTGVVMEPLIGFDGQDVALTLFLAAAITGISTGVIRHFMVDWMAMAKAQETVRAFQKELRQARKDENKYKVKKLTELQPELMKIQAEMSGQQFKPMGFTMLIVVPMFAWLWEFLQNLQAVCETAAETLPHYCMGTGTGNQLFIQAPWGETTLLTAANVVSFLPTWILIYSLFSIPLGQLVQKGLKAVEFGRTLREKGEPHA